MKKLVTILLLVFTFCVFPNSFKPNLNTYAKTGNNTIATTNDTTSTTHSELEESTNILPTFNQYIFDFKERKALLSAHESLNSLEPVYITREKEFFKKEYYKLTIDSLFPDFIYQGNLKDNKPHGLGYLFKIGELSSSDSPIPIYVGNFKNGRYDGYGILYKTTSGNGLLPKTMHIAYDGFFKNGVFNGKGNSYMLNAYDEANYLEILSNLGEVSPSYDIPPLIPSNIEVGYFKNNKISGKIKYYEKDYLIYEGNSKHGNYHGKGKLYYSNGTLKYAGTFNKGEYNGKGTLYNEDGSTRYSGKWKMGQIK